MRLPVTPEADFSGGTIRRLDLTLELWHERRREELQTLLATLQAPEMVVDTAAVRRQLRRYISDGQSLLRSQVPQAQQILRRLVVGRLTFTPHADGYYTFSGKGTAKPLLAGVVCGIPRLG